MAQKVSEQVVMDALKQCMDPEVPLSVVDLGLIYGVAITDKNDVNIKMTMTTRGCPLHDTLVKDVKRYNFLYLLGTIYLENSARSVPV
jgi:metal-sulfur cluster biosynthetic enzyme